MALVPQVVEVLVVVSVVRISWVVGVRLERHVCVFGAGEGVGGNIVGDGNRLGLRRETDVEGLEGVRFGLAVGTVVFCGGAVDADYVFFSEVCGKGGTGKGVSWHGWYFRGWG